MQSPTDDHILDLILVQKDVDRGFRLLVRKYQERIYWLVRRMVISHEDANDLCQEIFVKIYRHLERFERQAALYTWMYRIATNECLSFLRSRSRKKYEHLDPADFAGQLAADTWFHGEEAEAHLTAAIGTLPDKQRLVFHLRYFDEMPYQEMSRVLDTSEGALKASYHHAMKKVEQYLLNHGKE